MSEPAPFDQGVTRAMELLRARIQPEIHQFMGAVERNGGDYALAAIQAVGVLAEEQAVLLGCLTDDEWRRQCTLKLNERLLEAVEIAHSRALVRAGLGGTA